MGSIENTSDVISRDRYSLQQGLPPATQPSRADELSTLLTSVLDQIVPFIRSADDDLCAHQLILPARNFTLVDPHQPNELSHLLSKTSTLTLPKAGTGQAGLETNLQQILKYSVNTFAPGFFDKLYSAPSPPGIAASLILDVLNTNVHVYQVSPVLTLIEKAVNKRLATLFGLSGPRAGGINVQGGSASNMTAIVVARNSLFPDTKVHGNSHDGRELVLFTSAHGHYSIEKAAQSCGLGSAAVVSVLVDQFGRMIPAELEQMISLKKGEGKTPFYVNATAGTTVLGSFDPFVEISAIARRHGMWMHVDGAWGGSFVFSKNPELREKLRGVEMADSVAINPHKMLGVPVTCSFLLARDLKQFWRANTLPAGYLFHGVDEEDNENLEENIEDNGWKEPYDLADLTLQCGRRGDSLKMFMSWQYYGSDGFAEKVDEAYDVAQYMVLRLKASGNIVLVSQVPTPCLQVCFHYALGGQMMFGTADGQARPRGWTSDMGESEQIALLGKSNSMLTEGITKSLLPKGFMIDYAPALEGQEHAGKFFRVVLNVNTRRSTVERLVNEIEMVGRQVCKSLRNEFVRD